MMAFVGAISVSAEEAEPTLSITLVGNSTIYLQKGTEYKEFGATAYDTVEGDLTESIAINNPINKDSVGTYTVSYSVSNGSAQKAVASRTVVVFDSIISEELYTQYYGSYTYSLNYFKKIIPTKDGGLFVYGEVYYSSYSDLFYVKYDADMKLLYSNMIHRSNDDYAKDAVQTSDGNVILLSYNRYNSSTYITLVDGNDGSEKHTAYMQGVNYERIEIIEEDKYILCSNNGNQSYSIMTYNRDNVNFEDEKVTTEFGMCNSFVMDGCIYSMFYDGRFFKMDLETLEYVQFNFDITFDKCEYVVKDSYFYCCFYQAGINTIYKMTSSFEIVEKYIYEGSSVESIYVDDLWVISKFDDEILFFKTENLDLTDSIKTKYDFQAYDLCLDKDNLYFAGQYYRYSGYSGNYYCGLVKISDVVLFDGVDSYIGKLNQIIDYYNGLEITDVFGNSLGTFTCDSSQVDNTKAGNYKAYYTFTTIEDEDVKTYYVGRNIIIEPKTTFEDGATYIGSKVVDVEGGSVTINGVPYSYGDIYNIPGESTMIITGENGYTKTINFTVELTVEGVENGVTYFTNLVPVISGGEITLDGETYISETPVTTKGHHTFVIKGANGFKETIKFTLETTIIGVADGQTYKETLYPDINGENMTLNGVAYNNEPIENCGNYTLIITGTNDYSKTISFVVETVVSDLVDGEIYEEKVTPSFTKGTVTLNGDVYISGTTIYTPGLNTLVITGEDGYSVTYQFTINLGVENVANGETYIGAVTPIISGGVITLNGEQFVSGTKIDVPGNYTITVLGADGYRKDISFIVKPYEVNVTHGETYHHSVVPTISKGNLTLNGAPYISGSVINTSGEYTLVIIGENGYYESITFTLVTGANVESGAHYNEPITLKFVGTATLNGEEISPNTIIEEVGNYQLVLVDGENTFTYDFVLEPDYSIFDERITNCEIDFDNCSIKLNGEVKTTPIAVSEVGKYTLTVDGVNGYTKTITFDICAETNVENGGEYSIGLTVNAVGGTISLNGKTFVDGTVLTDVGTYTLQIEGSNGHKEIIVFDIIPGIDNIENATVYYGSVTPSIAGGTVTLNGKAYVSGTAITEEGVYRLVVSGVGGYENVINFVVLSNEFEIKENGMYMQTMSITHNVCNIEINGLPYEVGNAINTVGKNTLSFVFNGEKADITFYIFPMIEGVEEGQSYTGSVTPVVEWSNLLLDGKVFASGTAITEVGHHTLTIANLNGYNYEINFTVVEVWENIEQNGEYEYSVVPKTSNGTLYLNGSSFTSGNTIYTVGHHTIKIVGVNGYENTIEFTVTERITNLVKDGEFTGAIKPTFSNITAAYLDGQAYSSGTNIRNVGYHTLKIEGMNGYVSEYQFTILPTISGAQADTIYYPGNTYVSCSYATIKLNGESYSSGSTIYKVGYHTVEIIGTNGYSYTYGFTVLPSYSGIANGDVKTDIARFYCDYATLLLNGEAYSSGAYIYDIGYHTIEIVGVGGYSENIQFTRIESTSITDGEIVSHSKSVSVNYLSNFKNTVVTYDGKVLTSSKTEQNLGYHILTIEGVNGYKVEKTFTIKANWTGVGQDKQYNSTSGTYLKLINSNSNVLSETYYEKILIDGQAYTNNTYFYAVGNHKFEIYGTNGYIQAIDFVINPVFKNIKEYSSLIYKNDASYPFTESNGIFTSTNKANSVVSKFTITATIDVEFVLHYYVSAESNYDYLIIKQNGEDLIKKSGKHDWSSIEIKLKAGESIQIWYDKDGSQSSYEDCVKFKVDLEYENVGTKILPEIYLSNTNTFQDINTYILLDGEPYELNSVIDTVGYHTLEVNGVGGYKKEYNFIVIPNISNIQNEGVYAGELIPIIDNCELLLDGKSYVSGNPIVSVGNHTIDMLGVNGYILSYDFTITPLNVEDFSDKIFYKEVAIDTIPNATLYLDGEEYNGEVIRSLGYHTIKIEGANGYEQQISFTVTEDPILKGVDGYKTFVDGFVSKYMVNITIPDAQLFIDGKEYTSGTDYYEVGLHYLRIVGANGYEEEYTFTLQEKIDGLVQGMEYPSFQIDAANIKSMTLNGQTIDSQYTINIVGNYRLVVTGTNGYTNEYNFTIALDLKNVSNEGEYDSAVAPVVNASSIVLNGAPFVSGTTISNVGNYTMIINGVGGYQQQITFTINAKIEGVENRENYLTSICPSINSNKIYLNNNAYTSGTTISNVGNYTMRILGSNGYEKVITFTIKDNLSGVINNGVYNQNVTPTFNNATATLDGSVFTSGTVILNGNVGIHKLVIKGEGGYQSEYVFTMEPTISNLVENGKYQGSVAPVISGGAFQLNGKVITLDQAIQTVGHNTLTINGTNGYIKNIKFTVEPVIHDLQNSYFQTYTPNIEGTPFSIRINGNLYTNGTPIEITGNNRLTIYGNGGYSKTFNFTIEPQILGVENNSIAYDNVVISVSPSATLTIDDVKYTNNSTYYKVGNHNLKISGVNGYEKTVSFTLKEDSSLISSNSYIEKFNVTYDKNYFGIQINGQNYMSESNYLKVGNHELKVVGSNGYESSYQITVVPSIGGIEDNGSYIGKAVITTSNIADYYIDDTPYVVGQEYRKIGNHILTIKGTGDYEYKITFTVEPEILGVEQDGTYESSANWKLPSDCIVYLDDTTVKTSDTTSKIGVHTLKIEGTNGYQTTVVFTVIETINVTNEENYTEAMTISIPDCLAYLNDDEISGEYKINTPGSYKLKVVGTNGYTNEYTFTITSVLTGVESGKEYTGGVTANTSVGQWYLDDEPYESGTLITEIGNHTLKVSGFDYEQICTFTITVDVSIYAENLEKFNYTDTDIELYLDGNKYTPGATFEQVGNHTVEYRGANGYISSAEFVIEYERNGNLDNKYQDSAIIDIPNATLFVNGKQVENLTRITSIGNNIVTIKGTNGYEKTIEILITPTLTVADGEERNEKITIKKLDAKMYLDGVAINGDTVVDNHGKHTLKIEGANGYVQEVSFTYSNPNNSYVILIGIVIGLVAVAFVVIIILRKKVL